VSDRTQPSIRLSAPTVMIVDDQEPVRQLVAAIVEQYLGARFDEAADGAEALRRIAECRPTLVLTDLMMPGVDGLDLTRRLKADPATRDIPIVAMSGGPNQAGALAAGCDGFIAKPFRPQALADLLRR
jgi:CheY-like chemotaxis protein